MGLYTFSYDDYKEYIGTDFAALTIGQTYTMSITVSLADGSGLATDGLGVFFTTYQLNKPMQSTTLMVTPQVDYSSFGIITDKINWVTLSKTFVADSAYTHLVVGGFKPYGIMLIDSVGNSGPFANSSYYYIGRIGDPDSTRHSDTDKITIPLPPIDTTKPVVEDTVRYQFPSAFTPNMDCCNNIFRIIGRPSTVYKDYTLRVFNRWGELLFITDNPASGWDGTFNNKQQDIGTYFYMAQFTVDGKRELLKGNVTLIR